MKRFCVWVLLAGGCADLDANVDVQPVLARAPRLLVDDDRVQCPAAGFTTIQAAVDAASPGETLEICAGLYAESVRVDRTLQIVGPRRGVDGRTRALDSEGEARIASPRPFGITADGVVLDGLTIQVVLDDTGEGAGVRSTPFVSGTVVRNCVLDADGVTAFFPGSNGTLRTIAKRNHFYNRLGIASSNDEPYVPAHNLLVTENLFTNSSIGLFSREDRGVVVSHNRFEGGRGVILAGVTDAKVYGNTIVDPIDDGITVDESVNAWVSDNVLSGGAGFDGVRLMGNSTTVKVQRATVTGFRRGIVLEGSTGNQVLDNDVIDSAEQGLSVDAASSGNRLADNVVYASCVDASTGPATAGTANKWVNNVGRTSSPPGICAPLVEP